MRVTMQSMAKAHNISYSYSLGNIASYVCYANYIWKRSNCTNSD